MIADEISFERPPRLEAVAPPEELGTRRDEVRLLLSRGPTLEDHRFIALPDLLEPEDLLVVNQSATWSASLPARAAGRGFLLNLSTRYSPDLWVAEARIDPATPGPVSLRLGAWFEAAGVPVQRIAGFPGIERLSFYRFQGDVQRAMALHGAPIRYGYLSAPVPLSSYQTEFSRVDGSAEMPSAGRPFTARVLRALERRGIRWTPITLHTGVSSLDRRDAAVEETLCYPEPFEVTEEAVRAVEETRRIGGRVIAVGTTVVRALESAIGPRGLRPSRGFTRAFIHPGRALRVVDGLVTGFHDRGSTHLRLLSTFLPGAALERAYRSAVARGYKWHEFGDSHLILRG
ncbi:MAG TPA: S-adenosylmethionine:tRNA ribosyltransferase-isomerase [Thermoplasmata archaeon]